jgi:hypothetical protein
LSRAYHLLGTKRGDEKGTEPFSVSLLPIVVIVVQTPTKRDDEKEKKGTEPFSVSLLPNGRRRGRKGDLRGRSPFFGAAQAQRIEFHLGSASTASLFGGVGARRKCGENVTDGENVTGSILSKAIAGWSARLG